MPNIGTTAKSVKNLFCLMIMDLVISLVSFPNESISYGIKIMSLLLVIEILQSIFLGVIAYSGDVLI